MKKSDSKKSFSGKKFVKNKADAKASVNSKNKKPSTPKVPGEWFYMCPGEITVEDLKKALEPVEGIDLEIWKEMGVLEATLCKNEENYGMDFSLLELDLQDDYSNEFLKEHQVKTLFSVSFKPENYDTIKNLMLTIKESLTGFFCGDTDDFTPEV